MECNKFKVGERVFFVLKKIYIKLEGARGFARLLGANS